MSANLFQRAVAALALASFAAGAMAQAASTGSAQDYPFKPIRLIIPFTPGGGTDFLSRVVAAKLSETLKWTVVLENKPGAGGNIGLDAAAKSAPDGYAMVMGQLDNLAIGPWLHSSLPYDPIKSFTPIALVADSPLVLVVSAQSPYTTVADVVAAAKASPGKLTLASAGNGTTGHLTGELFQTAADIRIQHVPYKGSAPALADVMGGQVDMSMPSAPSALALVKSGKLRASCGDIRQACCRPAECPDHCRVRLQGSRCERVVWPACSGRYAAGDRHATECRDQQSAEGE